MKTAEEKAIVFVRELQRDELANSNHSGFYILPELLGVAHHSFMVGYNEAMRWTKLSDDIPTVDKNGEKVLICRLLNESQSGQNPSVYPTKLIHVCNPAETWWMEIPKLPI